MSRVLYQEYDGPLGNERPAEYWREVPGQDGNYYRELSPDEVSLSIPGPAIQPIDPRVPSDLERELQRLRDLQTAMLLLQPSPPLIIQPWTITADGTDAPSMTFTSPSLESPPFTYRSIVVQKSIGVSEKPRKKRNNNGY